MELISPLGSRFESPYGFHEIGRLRVWSESQNLIVWESDWLVWVPLWDPGLSSPTGSIKVGRLRVKADINYFQNNSKLLPNYFIWTTYEKNLSLTSAPLHYFKTISSPTSEYHYQLSQGFSPHWVTGLYISGLKVLIFQWCHIIWNRPTFSAITKYNVALCDDRSIFFQNQNWIILKFRQFIYLEVAFILKCTFVTHNKSY